MLLNLIKHQPPEIDKIYLYIKDPLESKYQLEIIQPKIGDAYKNLEEYNPTR